MHVLEESCLKLKAFTTLVAFAMCMFQCSDASMTDLNATALILNVPVETLPWKLKLATPKVFWKHMERGDISRLLDVRTFAVRGMFPPGPIDWFATRLFASRTLQARFGLATCMLNPMRIGSMTQAYLHCEYLECVHWQPYRSGNPRDIGFTTGDAKATLTPDVVSCPTLAFACFLHQSSS